MIYRNIVKIVALGAVAFALSYRCGIYNPKAYLTAQPVTAAFTSDEELSVPILTYHRFSSDAADSKTINVITVEEQLKYLKAHGYAVIPLRSLYTRRRYPMPLMR